MDLSIIQTELAAALQEAEAAKTEFLNIETAYQEQREAAIKAWEAANAELVAKREAAKEKLDTVSTEAATKREAAKSALIEHWKSNPDDKKPIEGFSLRLDKDINLDALSVDEIIKAGATFLLKVDEKVAKTFIADNAEQLADNWLIKPHLRSWMPSLANAITTKRTPMISDGTLMKVKVSSVVTEF